MHRRFLLGVVLVFALFLLPVLPTAAKGMGPQAVAVSPDGQRVYVADSATASLDVIDTATNQLVARVKLSPRVSNYGLLPGVAVSPDGTRIYVTDPLDFVGHTNFGTLLVIDAASLQVIARVEAGVVPEKAAVSPDGQRVYVTNWNSGTVTVIDAAANRAVTTVRVSEGPSGLAVTPDGRRVYVADSAFVSVIDTATNQVTDTIPVTHYASALAISPDGRLVYVIGECTCTDEIDVIDTATNQVVGTFHPRASKSTFPFGVVVSPDGQQIYLPLVNVNALWKIDAASDQMLASMNLAEMPADMAISPDGARLYLADTGSKTLQVVDTATDQVVATVKLGKSR